MEIFSLIAILALFIGTFLWVLKPLWSPDTDEVAPGSIVQVKLTELEHRRLATYAAIKDLEQDYESGKIIEVDYRQTRTRLVHQAAETLKQIEVTSDATGLQFDEEIDALLSQIQSNTIGKALKEQAQQQIRRDAVESASGTCPNCQAPIQSDDVFCGQCGATLGNRCPTCREPASPGDTFCMHCGTRLPEVAK